MTKIIGITGGIASGKSTAARMLKRPGAVLFNADQCVHNLLTNHHACIALVKQSLPKSYENGVIDRAVLAKMVANDEVALATLEDILHPFVREQELALIDMALRNRMNLVILDIPLLFETDAQALCDAVIAVDVNVKTQKRRAFLRPGMNEEKYDRLLARQWSAAMRNNAADFVVTSNLGRANMFRQLQQICQKVR